MALAGGSLQRFDDMSSIVDIEYLIIVTLIVQWIGITVKV